MCLQCVTNAKTISEEFLPGYYLMISKKDHPNWPKGYYGLVICNDPSYVFSQPEKNNCNACDKMRDELEEQTTIEGAYDLVRAAKKVGYRPSRHGFLTCFLVRRMQKLGLLKDNSKTDWLGDLGK